MMQNAKPGEPIFHVSQAKIRSEWKSHGGEKVHDIRSYVATEIAKKVLKSLIPPNPKTDKEFKNLQLAVATVAAKKLGNRPEESLITYINPKIFEVAK
jgi:hypothetical protein